MKFQSLTIRARLLGLALGLVVPLVLIGFYNLWSTWRINRQQLDESVERQAELAATAFEQWIGAQKQTLLTIRELTENNESSLVLKDYLNSIVKTRPNWLDVQIVSGDGEVELSQSFKDRPLPSITIETLRREVAERKSLVIFTEQISEGKFQLLSMALPLNNGDFVIARIDGASASQIFERLELPEEHIIAVFDGKDRLLYRSHVSPEQLSQYVSSTPLLSAFKEKKSGSVEVESQFDKVKRVYGFSRLNENESVVAIGVPSSSLYEPARSQYIRQLLFSLFVTLLAILLAYLIARSITEPLRLLSRAARAFGEGDLSARAEITQDETIREVGLTFNQMAEQIAEREEKLKELDKLKSEFVSSVSHELRTPLTTIKTLTRVLQRNNISPADREEYLRTIAFECDRQIEFVQNLLDLSRIESGAYRISLRETDILEVLESCYTAQKTAAKTRGLQMIFDKPSHSLFWALTDAGALRRIVLSLLENAVKYTPEGGKILLSVEAEKSRIKINIADTGCGIAPEDVPRIFEKFYRGKSLLDRINYNTTKGLSDRLSSSENEFTGVGLGLYLVKNLADQIGAEISVKSPVEQGRCGTLFVLKISLLKKTRKQESK